MENSVSRTLIETVVRKALRDIGDSPERSSRNLIDMALNFAEGRFQQIFFQTARQLLGDEHSTYYSLVRDTVAHVDHDRLVTFGMNVGYNSCTWGARVIREKESALGFDIPWSLILEIDPESYPEREEDYRTLIVQGKEMGIYTWTVFAGDAPERILPLIAEHDDCAFELLCGPKSITEAFLDEVCALNNLMVVVRACADALDACARLRNRRLLYSLYVPYGAEDVDAILEDEHLCGVQPLHPVFTAFVSKTGCPEDARRCVHEFVVRERMTMRCHTILWELIQDGMAIDRVISDDACSAAIAADGSFYALSGPQPAIVGNIFGATLEEMFRCAFPKNQK